MYSVFSCLQNSSPPGRAKTVASCFATLAVVSLTGSILGILSLLGSYHIIGVGALSKVGCINAWILTGGSSGSCVVFAGIALGSVVFAIWYLKSKTFTLEKNIWRNGVITELGSSTNEKLVKEELSKKMFALPHRICIQDQENNTITGNKKQKLMKQIKQGIQTGRFHKELDKMKFMSPCKMGEYLTLKELLEAEMIEIKEQINTAANNVH